MNDRVIASAMPSRVRAKKNRKAVAAISVPRNTWAGSMSRVNLGRPCQHQTASANTVPNT
jgi:hypothetical protein